jgi:hypothetical protein
MSPKTRQSFFRNFDISDRFTRAVERRALDIVLAARNIAESGKFHRIFRNQGLRDGIALGSMNLSTRGKSCRRKGRISWASAP